MGDDPKGEFRLTSREVRTAVPVDTTEIPIRLMDWKRIFRKIRQIPEHSALYSNLTFFAFGVAGSAAITAIPLLQRQANLEPWVMPTILSVCLASLILGLVFGRMARDKDLDIQSTCKEVMTDMRDVHQCSFPGQDIEPPKLGPNNKLKIALRMFFVFLSSMFLLIACAVFDFGTMRGWFIFFACVFGLAALITALCIAEILAKTNRSEVAG